ncbi:30S ribosomal protein S15, partial [candidate division WOR-3 bacterium]|nr:30S ribosomal protein S15 [candidate division WOR-3 bacterium]
MMSEMKVAWSEYRPEEIIELIKKFYHEGKTKSEIGMILRDQYGIPNAKLVIGKSISEILTEQGIKEEIPEDLMNLIRKSVTLMEHM